MHDGSQGNAMTEIALALSMGFFSMLVLTMVSLGAGMGEDDRGIAEMLTLVPSAEDSSRADQVDNDDTIFIYFRGGYFSPDLAPLDPNGVASGGRVVLAVDPNLPMTTVMKAAAPFATGNFVVASLNVKWLETLRSMESGK